MTLQISRRIFKVTPERLDEISNSMQIKLPGVDSSKVDTLYFQLMIPLGNVHTVGGISFEANDIIAECDIGKCHVSKGFRNYTVLSLNYFLFQHTVPYKLISL